MRVLFRPPAERSHYYDPKSREFALRALEHLAAQPKAVLVLLPRHSWQLADLEQFAWRNEPLGLERAVPFVSLLKGVDLAVSSGGTMLRGRVPRTPRLQHLEEPDRRSRPTPRLHRACPPT